MSRLTMESLLALKPCDQARRWLEKQSDDVSLYDLWRRCKRPDWLLWLAGRRVDRRLLVLAACDCAERALVHVPEGEDRPRAAIETARRWAEGQATLEEVRAAYAYASSAACAAAYAAAYADAAADAAAYAAACAASDAVADAGGGAYADAAAYASAAAAERRIQCRLIRRRIPWRLVRDGGVS